MLQCFIIKFSLAGLWTMPDRMGLYTNRMYFVSRGQKYLSAKNNSNRNIYCVRSIYMVFYILEACSDDWF